MSKPKSARATQGDQAASDRLDNWLRRKISVRYNTLRGRTEILRPKWRPLTDHDCVNLTFEYEGSTGTKVSSARMYEAVIAYSDGNKFDSLAEHIHALPLWDGTPRLDTWLNYISVPDTEYSRLAGRKWIISAIARAIEPGCKADGVLILHGKQGIGKSTLLKDLATEEFFKDVDFDFSRPAEAGLALRGCWIHEWGELDNMSRATATRLKAFISETHNRFRPPYGRSTVEEPRRCVFAGSSNKDDFLTDTTGNRRFWPVDAGLYDRDGFLKVRDQLLAEAYTAYNSGEVWWFNREQEEIAETPRILVSAEDPWTDTVEAFVKGRDEVKILDILEHLTFPLNRVSRYEQSRVAGILRGLGYERKIVSGRGRLWKLARS